MKDEALKLALEVMHNQGDVGVDEWIATEAAINQALATPAQPEQEPVAFYVYEWINPSDGVVFRSFRADEYQCGREPDRTVAVPTPPTAQQIDEAYAVGYSNGMTEGYEAGKAYAAAQRTWVGLTDAEIQAIHDTYYRRMGPQEFARAIEAKLKERNT
jgi:hypothetical protein